ncbi:MAG: hypothetical protein A2026_14225 [Deltaproteobacteria bacterium RBG_19FT_COMBO_46_12]|nr:MAG: hypothetical protein A2026_14225 [Deltaproteobacteria bacterium RBG_19FT_COMBO_46_12]
MVKGETLLEKTIFLIHIVYKILTPPLYSLERLEKYCKYRIQRNSRAYLPRWFLAGLYKDFQKYQEAKQQYLEIKHLGYMTYKDKINFAEVLFRLGEYQNVIDLLLPQDWSEERTSNRYLGLSYLKLGKFHEAIHHLEKVIATGKPGYEDYWQFGFCYDRLGNLEKAKEAYMKVLSMKPDSKELRENLALIHIRIGQSFLDTNLEEAKINFKTALEINPGDKQAIKLLENVQKVVKNLVLIDELKQRERRKGRC